MTPEEQRNIELAKRWEETYNTDTRRLVSDCYAADCEVNDGFVRGHAQLLKIEQDVLEAAPKRRMRVDRRHATGNVVIVEAVLLDPDQGEDWQLPFCAVLTCRDGTIVTDRTYAEFSKWPGL